MNRICDFFGRLVLLSDCVRRVQAFLLMAVCFVLPMRASYVYVISGFLLIAVALDERLRDHLSVLVRSRPCQLAIAYFSVVLFSMLWTENNDAGWRFVGRHVPFLLFCLYWVVATSKIREVCLNSFVSGLVVCALLAHYNWFQHFYFPELPRGIRVFKSLEDTAPFVDRIMYSPLLAVGLYIALDRLFSCFSFKSVFCWFFVVLLLASNLSFSGGRAGMVAFSAMFVLMVLVRYSFSFRALFLSFSIVFVAFSFLYFSQDYFRSRVDAAVVNLKGFENFHGTSEGERLIYWGTSAIVFIQNPLLGVGAGDFQSEYVKARPERWKDSPDSYNPHNQFLLTAATTGLLGLGVLCAFFVSLLKEGGRRTLIIMSGFLVASIFESYLWRSNTSLAFMALMAVTVAPMQPVQRFEA